MAAYDYQAQRWVDGDAGTALATSQLTDTIAMLNGKTGTEFARFLGRDRGEALQEAQAALRSYQEANV